MLAGNKHSSLVRTFVNYGRKIFYKIIPGVSKIGYKRRIFGTGGAAASADFVLWPR
jgi:hypothetical protein